MKTKLPVLVATLLGAATLPHLLAEVTITRHPTNQVVSLNAHVTNSVTTTSTAPPITYQWYGKGELLPDQTNRTLVLNNIQLDQAGEYTVVVNDADNQPVQSNPATVTVDPTFTKVTAGDIVTDQEGTVTGAWGDYDGDGFLDLYVANTASSGVRNSLYRNNGDGTFTKQLTNAFLQTLGSSVAAAWADIDNDGDLDLVVARTYSGPTEWLRNDGSGQFTARQLSAASGPLCPVFADFDGDGWVDLFLSHMSGNDLAYQNNRDGTFRQLTAAEAGVAVLDGEFSAGAVAGDYDGDGDADLWVGMEPANALYRNDGSGKFERVAHGSLEADTLGTTANWVDYDNDGRLDVFVIVYGGGATSQLLHNDGDAGWTSIPLGASLQTGGASWADFDNDGDLDLFIMRGQTTTTTNLLYANNGDGTFTQVTFGSLANDQGRWAGSAWADYDNNGFQDLFVTGHTGTREVLYRNHGNGNHWISFKLVGTRSNRSAIGAKVRVRATIFGKTYWQLREIGGGNRHQNDLRPHFGLGDAQRATQVYVEWPLGTVEEFANLARDPFHTIVEPSLSGGIKPNGEFELSLWASTNRTCTIESSADLVNWTPVSQVQGAGETPVIVPAGPAEQAQRYYRMR